MVFGATSSHSTTFSFFPSLLKPHQATTATQATLSQTIQKMLAPVFKILGMQIILNVQLAQATAWNWAIDIIHDEHRLFAYFNSIVPLGRVFDAILPMSFFPKSAHRFSGFYLSLVKKDITLAWKNIPQSKREKFTQVTYLAIHQVIELLEMAEQEGKMSFDAGERRMYEFLFFKSIQKKGYIEAFQLLCTLFRVLPQPVKYSDYLNQGPPYTHLLHYACYHGNLEVAKALINSGQKENAEDRLGRTPIFYAIQSKNIELVKYLLNEKRCIEYNFRQPWYSRLTPSNYLTDKEGKSILCYAVQTGSYEMVRTFIEQRPPKSGRNIYDPKDENCPLMEACRRGHTEIILDFLMRLRSYHDEESSPYLDEENTYHLGCEVVRTLIENHYVTDLPKILRVMREIDPKLVERTEGHIAIWLFKNSSIGMLSQLQEKYGLQSDPKHLLFLLREILINVNFQVASSSDVKGRDQSPIENYRQHYNFVSRYITNADFKEMLEQKSFQIERNRRIVVQDRTFDLITQFFDLELSSPHKSDERLRLMISLCKDEAEQEKLLNIAISHNDRELIIKLLRLGVPLQLLKARNCELYDAILKATRSLLAACARRDHQTAIRLAKRAYEQGALINYCESTGDRPLLYAVRNNNVPLVEFLIAKGANPLLFSPSRYSALSYAVQHNNMELVYKLSNGPSSAMHMALKSKNYDLLDKIFQYSPELREEINRADEYGKTLFFRVCALGDVRAVQVLLRHGAISKFEDERVKRQALSFAYRSNNQDLITLLYEHEMKTRPTGNERNDLIFYAIEKYDLEAVKQLINLGFDLNGKFDRNYTPLMYASAKGDMDSVKLFIENGANLNAQTLADPPYDTPLSLAIDRDNYEIAIYLLDRGAMSSVRDPKEMIVKLCKDNKTWEMRLVLLKRFLREVEFSTLDEYLKRFEPKDITISAAFHLIFEAALTMPDSKTKWDILCGYARYKPSDKITIAQRQALDAEEFEVAGLLANELQRRAEKISSAYNTASQAIDAIEHIVVNLLASRHQRGSERMSATSNTPIVDASELQHRDPRIQSLRFW